MGSQSPARPQGLWTVLRVLLTQVSAELDRSWILVQISRKRPETTKDGERFQTAAEKAKEAHHFRRNQRTMTAAPRHAASPRPGVPPTAAAGRTRAFFHKWPSAVIASQRYDGRRGSVEASAAPHTAF